MAEVLTLEILEGAIRQIEKSEYHNEIIGFKLNPVDYEAIRMGTESIFVITNNKMILQPPYKGLKLELDVNVPPGYPEPIRRCKEKLDRL